MRRSKGGGGGGEERRGEEAGGESPEGRMGDRVVPSQGCWAWCGCTPGSLRRRGAGAEALPPRCRPYECRKQAHA